MEKDQPANPIRIIELDETPSTSTEALQRAAAGDLGPFWVLAQHQTKGRGRSGRSWFTAPGNLATTHLFQPNCPPAALPQVSLVSGVAVCDALASFWPEGRASGRLRLKWPNDIMIDHAKIGGLLVESSNLSGAQICTVGIGINLAHAPEVADRATDRLGAHTTQPLQLRAVVEAIANRFEHWRLVWAGGVGFDAIRSAWLAMAGAPGEQISVNAGDGPVSGAFLGLDTDGALLLGDANGARRRFTFGDVTLGPRPKA